MRIPTCVSIVLQITIAITCLRLCRANEHLGENPAATFAARDIHRIALYEVRTVVALSSSFESSGGSERAEFVPTGESITNRATIAALCKYLREMRFIGEGDSIAAAGFLGHQCFFGKDGALRAVTSIPLDSGLVVLSDSVGENPRFDAVGYNKPFCRKILEVMKAKMPKQVVESNNEALRNTGLNLDQLFAAKSHERPKKSGDDSQPTVGATAPSDRAQE